ncbi:DUF397 domain-containing protein [Stackebrandtia sp.]|uniref:DUF397 domain-containing protein n=1 Tax=Stackebrandtia sp. TaxID=2023065 RepID=UPI0032C21B03
MTDPLGTPSELTTASPKSVWKRSSRSGTGDGQNCVEVAAWRKSTRSSDGTGQCVEFALRRNRDRNKS